MNQSIFRILGEPPVLAAYKVCLPERKIFLYQISRVGCDVRPDPSPGGSLWLTGGQYRPLPAQTVLLSVVTGRQQICECGLEELYRSGTVQRLTMAFFCPMPFARRRRRKSKYLNISKRSLLCLQFGAEACQHHWQDFAKKRKTQPQMVQPGVGSLEATA